MQLFVACTLFAVAYCGPQGRGGPGGPGGPGGRGRHGPPPPPFLQNVNQTVRQEYFAIITNDNISIATQNQEIDTWAAQYGLTDQVNEFNANQTAFRNELQQNITNLIQQLPAANTQLQSIMNDDSLTRAQQRQQIEAFKNESRQAAEVLFFLPHVFRPPRGPGGPGGPGGFGGPGGRRDKKNQGRGNF